MPDLSRVQTLLERVEEAERRLHALRDRIDEVRGDPGLRSGVKYDMVVGAEACIDLAEHVVALSGWPRPGTYAEAFAALSEHGVLDEVLARDLSDLARFRNLLVHGYASVDEERVLDLLQTRLGDFQRFRRSVARWASAGESL